jgi:hypothetical protein
VLPALETARNDKNLVAALSSRLIAERGKEHAAEQVKEFYGQHPEYVPGQTCIRFREWAIAGAPADFH